MSSTVSSTSSSTSTTGTVSNGRYWGLASGLDVDSIVKGLVSKEQTKIDSANQQKQKIQWKQEIYNDIVSKINDFQSAYLDLTNLDTCMISGNTFSSFDATTDSALVSASANSDATAGLHTIVITQSATTSSMIGNDVNDAITGTTASATQANLTGKSFYVTADGVKKLISFTADDFSSGTIQDILNKKLADAFGTVDGTNSKVLATVDGSGNLTIDSNLAAGYQSSISVSAPDTAADSALSYLGLTSGASNRLNTNSSLATLFGSSISVPSDATTPGQFTIKINGKDIDLNTSDSLTATLNKINSSGAGVTASYSQTTDTFSLVSNTMGMAGSLTVDENGTNFLTTLFGAGKTPTQGQDAKFSVDGVNMTRSNNSFMVDGVTYTINQKITSASPKTVNVNLTTNTKNTEDVITKFVNAYNTLLDAINTQTTTKPDSDYQPLTSTQKSSMSDSQVTEWETKAKQGLLFNDTTLTKISDSLRKMMYQPVTTSDGKSLTLYNIGITTTYGGDGKLSISDKTALENALKENPSGVMDLFMKKSDIVYSIDGNNQKDRKAEEGLAQRVKDILNDAVTSTGIVKGSIITIIGDQNNTSKYTNSLYDQLKAENDNITELTTQLNDKKDRLYSQFSKLESAMEQMNQQSSWISSAFGSSS